MAPSLLSGSFQLPHLGDWMHAGQPLSHGQRVMMANVSRARASKSS